MARKNVNSGSERESLLLKAATLYYNVGLTQGEIATRLGFSRPTVVRMLQKVRETGLVEIRITKPLPHTIRLETELESALGSEGLRQAVIVDTEEREAKDVVAQAGAIYLREHLRSDHIVGIGWSTTLTKLLDHVNFYGVSPARIVQLGGHVGRAGGSSALEISMRLGGVLKAPVEQVPAPVIVDSKLIRDSLLKDPVIEETRRWVSRCNIGFVGIGVGSKQSRLVEAGYLKSNDMKKVVKKGAVGEILTHCYDIDGNIIDTPWADRTITVSLKELRGIDNLVTVAAGEHKVATVLGAIRAGIVNTLVADTSLATAILEAVSGAPVNAKKTS